MRKSVETLRTLSRCVSHMQRHVRHAEGSYIFLRKYAMKLKFKTKTNKNAKTNARRHTDHYALSYV